MLFCLRSHVFHLNIFLIAFSRFNIDVFDSSSSCCRTKDVKIGKAVYVLERKNTAVVRLSCGCRAAVVWPLYFYVV